MLTASLISAFIGLAALGYAVHLYRKGVRLRSWPSTEGLITRLQIRKQDFQSGHQLYNAAVEYDYTVGGRRYRGDCFMPGGINTMRADDIQVFLRPFAEGTRVRVYHDPQSPADSVLVPELNGSAAFGWMLMGSIALAMAFIFALIPR